MQEDNGGNLDFFNIGFHQGLVNAHRFSATPALMINKLFF